MNNIIEKRKVTIIDSDRDLLHIRPIKIAHSLKDNGYEVEFFLWDRTANRPRVEYVDGFKVNNFKHKPLGRHRIGLIISFILWWHYCFFNLIKKETTIYHCENLYNLIPAISIKIMRKRIIIYDILDFVADSYNLPSFLRKMISRFDNFCIKFTDGVIIVDEYRKKQIDISKIKNFAIVMNCPNDIFNQGYDKRSHKNIIIYYGGWITESRGLKNLCYAIKDLSDIEVIIAGLGPDLEKLKPIFNSQNNIYYKGLVSYSKSLDYTKNSDLIFAFYDPKIPINRLASPNKVFDAMMCSTPIIANSEAIPISNIIKNEKCGILLPYNDIKLLRITINGLKQNKEKLIEMGKNGRKAYERKYNWIEMQNNLIRLYEKTKKE